MVTKLMKYAIIGIILIIIIISGLVLASQLLANPSDQPTPTNTPTPTATQQPTPTTGPSTSPSTSPNTPTPTAQPTLPPGATPTPTPTPPPATPTPSPSPTPVPTISPGTIVTYNFDSGSPLPILRQTTPITTTISGITATFTAPPPSSTSSFSIQDQTTTQFTLSQFTAYYLEDNNGLRNPLDITFSQPIRSITFTFATIDYHDPGAGGTATPLQLTAYVDSAKATQAGSPVTSVGTFTTSTYPQGTLTFSSVGNPFRVVEIQTIFLAQGAVDFIVDNISVTVA